MLLTHIELITRIAVGAGLGGIIGYERDRHGRQVGLRTHLIVAMAAATFMVVSNHFVFYQNYAGVHGVEVDASRIAASVVSGIGFLAGGAILKTGATIQGLTTAAGLWLVTAIGLCAGGGMFVESVAVTLMGLIALTLLRRFEDKDDGLIRRQVVLELSADGTTLAKVIESLKSVDANVCNFNYKKRIDERRITVDFNVGIPESIGVSSFIEHLEKQEGIREIHVSQSF
jgi:putative Mg2+ transporter-C (MgtC) family protein